MTAPEIRTLHDAADALEVVSVEVERILDEAQLLERAHHLAVAEAGALVEGLTDEATETEMALASGWRRYYDLVDGLSDALGRVEQAQIEAHASFVAAFHPKEDDR